MQEKIQTETEKAISTIMMIRQEVATMGANDYEIPALDKLIDDLKNFKITPSDALKRAFSIQNSKQDYH